MTDRLQPWVHVEWILLHATSNHAILLWPYGQSSPRSTTIFHRFSSSGTSWIAIEWRQLLSQFQGRPCQCQSLRGRPSWTHLVKNRMRPTLWALEWLVCPKIVIICCFTLYFQTLKGDYLVNESFTHMQSSSPLDFFWKNNNKTSCTVCWQRLSKYGYLDRPNSIFWIAMQMLRIVCHDCHKHASIVSSVQVETSIQARNSREELLFYGSGRMKTL